MLLDVEFSLEILLRSQWFIIPQASGASQVKRRWMDPPGICEGVHNEVQSEEQQAQMCTSCFWVPELYVQLGTGQDNCAAVQLEVGFDSPHAHSWVVSPCPDERCRTWMLITRFQSTISTCYNSSQKGLRGIHIHFSLVLKKFFFSQLYIQMAMPASSFLPGPLTQEDQQQCPMGNKEELLTILWGMPGPGPTYTCGDGSAARQPCLGLATALLTLRLMSHPHAHEHPGAAQRWFPSPGLILVHIHGRPS